MAGSVKGIIVEIGGDTSKLQSALKKVNSSTSSLSKELKGINSLLKLDPKNTELVSQKQTVLKENIEQTSKKLEELKKTQEMADSTIANGGKISQENYRNLQREIINTENKLNSLKLESSKWTTAGRSIEEFGNKISNISSKIDAVGTTFTTRLTLPVAALATTAVTTTANFESSMTKVAATMGITADEIKKGSESYKILEEAAKKSGETTKYSASEAADALNYLALAGYDAKKSAEVLPKVLNLAAAGDLELATASDMVTDAMAALNMETKDLDKYINEMAKTSQKSNTSVAQLGEATLTCAGTVNLAGMSLETMNAELGILANNGIKGAEGGTHLRNIILSLTSPTDVAAKSLKKLGINVKDSSGNVRDLNDIMKDFDKKLDGLSEEKKINIISTIFNKTDISAVNSLIKGSGKEFSKLKKEISNCDNAAQDMADTMNSSLKGQATLVKSQMESIAITIGQKLMPTVKKIVEQISNLATGFSKLSDEEVENIIKIGALVAAIGPATKILGTLGNTVGTVSKGIGTFSQVIGVMKNNTTSGVASVDNLAKILTGLTSPVGLATIGITALAGTMLYLATKESEAQKEAKAFAEEMANQKQSYEDYNKSVDKTTSSNLAQIDSVGKLKEELYTLVDANGKVKSGYEGRVSFILNQLNNALGKEYKLNDNIIQSYKDLQAEIDTTIEKKKAEVILNSEQEKFANAKDNETEAVNNLKTATENLTKVKEEYGMSLDELRKKAEGSLGKEKEYLENIINAYDDATQIVKDNTEIQKQYAEDYALFMDGKYEEMGKSIRDTTTNWTNSSLETIRTSIIEQAKLLETYKSIYETTGNEVAKTQMEQAKQNLQNLTSELSSRTSTISTMSAGEITAWNTLARESYETYRDEINKMPKETKQKIQKMTGIVASNNTLPNAVSGLANKTTGNFQQLLNMDRVTSNKLSNVSGIINNNKSVEQESGNLGTRTKIMFEKKINSTNGKSAMTDYIQGAENGANQKKGGFWNLIFGIGKRANQEMRDGLGDGSPSVLAKQALIDYFLGADIGIEKQAPNTLKNIADYGSKINKEFTDNMKIPKVQDFGKLQGNLSSKIVEVQKTVFTTPQITFNVQELDEAKLQQCFNYINKKFGSQY